MAEVSKNNRALDNKCPACRAPLLFKPKLGKWKCEYCDNEYTLEELKKYNNASSSSVNEGANGDDTIYETYRCKDCGAEIIADENTAATFCVYCGNTAILKSKLSGKFAPTKVIPFKKTKEDAIAAFKKLKKGRPLIPKDFISKENIDKITGVYIPFWLYDISVNGDVTASGKIVKTWSVGDTHYTKVDTYRLVRGGEMNFLLIPVDGSTRFSDDIMNTIEPFDYKEMINYNHAYLSGFLAEKYDVDDKKSFEDAASRAINTTEDELRRSMSKYSSVFITSKDLKTNQEKYEYALLPVWMVNVKYKDKFYTFAMNGQTGEFVGDIPTSKKRLIACIFLTILIPFILVLLISYLMYLGGV